MSMIPPPVPRVAEPAQPAPVSFGLHFAQSQKFDELFRSGMALVERTAAYLEGQGRREAKGLKPPISIIYATESMRLTTRLLELASWLVVQRALRDGDISEADAEARRKRIKLRTLGRPSHIKHFEMLPAGLRELVVESFAFSDRLVQIDRAIRDEAVSSQAPAAPNPVGQQLERLSAAFATRI